MNRNTATISPAQLRLWLARHYQTQGEACVALGVAQRTLTSWLSGRAAPPLMLDRLMVAIDVNQAWRKARQADQVEVERGLGKPTRSRSKVSSHNVARCNIM
jgi:hypothetical protein